MRFICSDVLTMFGVLFCDVRLFHLSRTNEALKTIMRLSFSREISFALLKSKWWVKLKLLESFIRFNRNNYYNFAIKNNMNYKKTYYDQFHFSRSTFRRRGRHSVRAPSAVSTPSTKLPSTKLERLPFSHKVNNLREINFVLLHSFLVNGFEYEQDLILVDGIY